MERKSDYPLAKRNIYFSKTKLTTPSFHKNKLFKKKFNLSSSDLMTDIQQGYNFTFKITNNQELKIKRVRKPIEYNSEYLKNDLIAFHSEEHKRKNELTLLKIKFSKLLLDNIHNKTLLAKILSLPTNKVINRDLVFFHLQSCKLTKKDRRSLELAYEILKLKLELNSKKNLLSDKIENLSMLNENSAMKVVSHLQSEYFIKCEQQRSLVKVLNNLEKKYILYENKIIEMEEKLNKKNIKNENLINIEIQEVEQINQMLDEKNNLIKEINKLNDKMNKQKLLFNNKKKEFKLKEIINAYEQQQLKLIKEELNIIFEQNEEILEKKKSKEETEIFLKNQIKEIKILEEEFSNLNLKLKKFTEEKNRIIQKSNEAQTTIKIIETLLKELELLEKNKTETEQVFIKKQQELNERKMQLDNENKQYSKQIQINNNIKNELKQRIQVLDKNLNKLTNENDNIKSNIDQAKNELNKLNQNEISIKKQYESNDLALKEQLKKEMEENKKKLEQKFNEKISEIDDLKKEQKKLIDNNKNIEDENKLLQEEINEYDDKLTEYDHILEKFNSAKERMSDFMFKELVNDI